MKERAQLALVFCSGEHHRLFRGVTSHLLALGSKRGASAIEELTGAQQVDFASVDLPDDVLEVIFAWAFHYALRSREEYSELLDMRAASAQFRRVIDQRVIPSIHILGGEILSEIDSEELALFTGLHKFLFVMSSKRQNEQAENPFPQLARDRPWEHMAALRDLALTNVSLLRHPEEFSRLRFLVKLQLRNVGVTDEMLAPLIHVEDMSIVNCKSLSSACLTPMRRLVKLHLDSVAKFRDLNQCQTLRELSLGQQVTIHDAGIEGLAQLEALSLPRDTVFYEGSRQISAQVLTKFPSLVALDINGNRQIDMNTVNQLTALTKLNMAFVGPRELARLDALVNLTWLDCSGTDAPEHQWFNRFPLLTELFFDDMQGIQAAAQLPPSLRTLSLDLTRIEGGSLAVFTELTSLYLCTCITVKNRDLRQLTNLQVLDLTGNDNIRDATLASLVNLEELILVRNDRITFEAVAKLPKLRYLVAKQCLLDVDAVQFFRQAGVTVFDDRCVAGLDPLPPRYRERYWW